MSQDLARIRAFVQVFDSGGFSAAARQHGRSKALLSKYVTDLEDYLGVRLMNRTTRKLSLTEAGEAYYREASQLLQQLDDLDATISDQTAEPRGLRRRDRSKREDQNFKALARATVALLESWVEFMNLTMTSRTAPSLASSTPWFIEGSSVQRKSR